jgi:hypothetical protein
MTAKIKKIEFRPSLDHMFFREWRKESILRPNFIEDPTFNWPRGSLGDWEEFITVEEVVARQSELRPDVKMRVFGTVDEITNIHDYKLRFNPFSLTDTRTKSYLSEADMRGSRWMSRTLYRYQQHIEDIKRLENIITFQVFVDEKLVESFEFK